MYQDVLKGNVIAEIIFLPNKAMVEVFQLLNQFLRISYDAVGVKCVGKRTQGSEL